MSSMQSPPPLLGRQMSPVAVNTIISSLVTLTGIVMVVISGGFVMLASYIFHSALLTVPWQSQIRDETGFYVALAIIPGLCAIISFIFGLRIVSRGLTRLMQSGT